MWLLRKTIRMVPDIGTPQSEQEFGASVAGLNRVKRRLFSMLR